MKKLLLVLLGIVIVAVVTQKFGILNYFSSNPRKPLVEKKSTDTLPVELSPVINRPLIGVYYRMIDKQTASQNKLVEGAYITQIIKGSAAEKSNLREEDIIIQLDDKKISGNELQIITKLIADKKQGDKVNLKIWRNKEILTIIVTLGSDQ
jgi:S1-C subfamily serine protease